MQGSDDIIYCDACALGLRGNIIFVGVSGENLGVGGGRRSAVLEGKVCQGQWGAGEDASISSTRRARVWYRVWENLYAPRDPLRDELEAADWGRRGRLVKKLRRDLSKYLRQCQG